jgi:drug/metabolite transporter (DMT)-like permease
MPYILVQSFQYQFTKNGFLYASPLVLMSIRYVGVGLIFYFLGHRKIPLDRDALILATAASASTIFWSLGLQYVSGGDSAVLSYTMPLFSIPVAYVIIKERVSIRELTGAIVGFGGVVIYSLTLDHGSLLVGAILTILNAVFWAIFSVYYRKLRTREQFPLLTTQFLVGTIPMIFGSFFEPRLNFSSSLVVDIVYVIVFSGAIQFFLWNGLLRRARVGKVTTMAFAVPATTILIDSVATSSFPEPLAILGGAVMFVGIFIASWQKGKMNGLQP